MKKFRYLNPILLKQFHKSSSTTRRSIPSIITNRLLFRPLIPHLFDDRSSFGYYENPNFQISKRWHVGHSHHDQTSEEGDRIFRLGLAADVGLTAGKVLTGYLSGSTAIIADAAHSLSDVGYSVLNLAQHNFGSILIRYGTGL
ncbi:putative cation efflux protein [Helianthus anomalus]